MGAFCETNPICEKRTTEGREAAHGAAPPSKRYSVVNLLASMLPLRMTNGGPETDDRQAGRDLQC
jgi:hypothetical protein